MIGRLLATAEEQCSLIDNCVKKVFSLLDRLIDKKTKRGAIEAHHGQRDC